MELSVPLRQDQIEAAKEIRLALRYWQDADASLRRLGDALPGFDLHTTLLKVASINTLYATKLLAFSRMATHITKVLGSSPEAHPRLVERLALLRAVAGKEARRHRSFASKFCHFFIDAEKFPIYDTWAQWTVRHHLGRRREVNADQPYVAFVTNLKRLIGAAQLSASPSELDAYLWIRGGFEVWRRRRDAPMNGELTQFFTTEERSRLMKRLVNEGR